MRKDIARIERLIEGTLVKEGCKSKLESKYHIQRKGARTVREERSQRIIALTERIQWYSARNDQFHQNRLFQANQKILFEEIEGKMQNNTVIPDAEESKKF